ncbi:unnamed protein product [Aureobasidium vineae]|uniref:Uncharacterized protein n=1 Tax=Aureobasidium vineae TaxID=2773715 RepID=A0A9N8JE71_9PEZI|nr:unnamed protein product [Aureobasidium vineae]
MYTKIIPAILLAGQALKAAALPATTITIHSTIISTTVVPAITEAAGSNPSNAATPARFSPEANTTLTTLSSFSDASPSRLTQLTITVTETEAMPYPILITVIDYYCPTPTSEVAPSTSAASPESSSATASSTATPAPSSAIPSFETTSSSEPTKLSSSSSSAPATTATKACVFPIPGECDI